MKENVNLNRIAEQRMQVLRQSIKTRIEYSGESIGSIEKAIGVSEGYFSRIWKKGKTPDLFNICKFVEYMEIDYNLLFFPQGKKKALDEQIINRFLKFVEIETMESKLLWEKRINMLSKNYVFSCKLEYGEELRLYKIILEEENCYKLTLNGNL